MQLDDAVIVEHEPGGKRQAPSGHGDDGRRRGRRRDVGADADRPDLPRAALRHAPIGAASGAIAGKATDLGVDDDFIKELGSRSPGAAALIVLGSTDARDKVIDR